MRLLITISLIFLCDCVHAQEHVTVKGVVTDSITGQPVQDVGVYDQSTGYYRAITNRRGIFYFSVKPQNQMQIAFRHLGYERYFYVITAQDFRKAEGDTLTIFIRLKQGSIELKDKDILSDKKPDTVYGSVHYSVADFEFVDNQMVLLVYEKQLSKGAYVIIPGSRGEILSRQFVPDEAVRLFRNFRGEIFVVGKTAYYQVVIRKDEIFLFPMDVEVFENFHAIVNDTLEDKFYYSNYSDLYPAFTYYCSRRDDTTRSVLREIEDKFVMELYRSEYKYVDTKTKLWAARQEVSTGIDKEIWVGASSFTQSLYYKTLYAPLFVVSDTVVVFDHHNDYLFRYDAQDKLIDSIPIAYHKTKNTNQWEKPLIRDPKTGKIYAVFLRGAHFYLKEIIPTTGEVVQVRKLYYRFVDNIRVYDGKVYYVYRPFESSQRKFLYSE